MLSFCRKQQDLKKAASLAEKQGNGVASGGVGSAKKKKRKLSMLQVLRLMWSRDLLTWCREDQVVLFMCSPLAVKNIVWVWVGGGGNNTLAPKVREGISQKPLRARVD